MSAFFRYMMRFTPMIAVFAVVFTTGFALAQTWTGPTANPPNENVPAPINVGDTDQVKDGGLGVGALSVFGSALIDGTTYINDGNRLRLRNGNGWTDIYQNTPNRSIIRQYDSNGNERHRIYMRGDSNLMDIEARDANGNRGARLRLHSERNRSRFIEGDVRVDNNLDVRSDICLGGECRGSWSELGGIRLGSRYFQRANSSQYRGRSKFRCSGKDVMVGLRTNVQEDYDPEGQSTSYGNTYVEGIYCRHVHNN